MKESGYQAPKEFHLAYVPCDESNPDSERWIKCLLCNKFQQDEWSHIGQVGELDPSAAFGLQHAYRLAPLSYQAPRHIV